MRVWRICKSKYAASAYEGVGAAVTGNRWNERGVRVAYASATISLAALELLVHVDPLDAPDDLVAVPADIPRGAPRGRPGALPLDWRTMPAPASTAAVGTRWAQRGKTLVLRVPSVVVPSESNYLVNPAHPAFPTLLVGAPVPFAFDPGLFA
jgi:RES domain-containing protein